MSSPAPLSSTRASATSPITSTLRRELRRKPMELPRPPSRNAEIRSVRAIWMAGASPNRTPVKMAMAAVNRSTRASTAISPARGRMFGVRFPNRRVPPQASTRPTAAPRLESSTLSVSSWRIRRPRPAPNALRMPISLRRAADRDSSRLARFTQAISSTKPTAAVSVTIAGRTFPTTVSRRLCRVVSHPALEAGYAFSARAAMMFRSACAAASVTPSRRRPMPPR